MRGGLGEIQIYQIINGENLERGNTLEEINGKNNSPE